MKRKLLGCLKMNFIFLHGETLQAEIIFRWVENYFNFNSLDNFTTLGRKNYKIVEEKVEQD